MTPRRDLIRVMHHTLKVLPNGYGYPRCGQRRPRANVTDDRAEVTCKKCRKILGLPAAACLAATVALLAGPAWRYAHRPAVVVRVRVRDVAA